MPEAAGISAIVLAAGRATRFGSHKLLQPLALDGCSAPMLAHSVRPWLQVFDTLTLVVRPGDHALRAALPASAAVRWVEAVNSDLGMGHSLAAGVAANRDCAGWVIGLADMPRLPAAVIAQVRDALQRGATLAAPFHLAQRGHPAGFGRIYADELLALSGDAGARHILERDAARLARIPVQHPGVLLDVDRLSDIEPLNVIEETP
ncbi:MAG: nucleotidyltransferase family protein [Methylobacterium sp.]|nr:nucleotidyltransferase family protein [Methylobacterium sp.]